MESRLARQGRLWSSAIPTELKPAELKPAKLKPAEPKSPRLKTALRATALSLALAWSGAAMLTAAAQTALPEAAKGQTEASADSKAKPAAKKSAARKAGTETAQAEPLSPQEALDGALDGALDEVDPAQSISQTVIDLAGWVLATGDNRDMPFALVDKEAAQVLVFGADGKLRGLAPVLLGSAVGDNSAPGVGDRELSDIPMEDRTTPAGRFLAGYGPATGGARVLWVDYATAVSIHPIAATRASRKEKRKERLASPEVDDNRITHGCINVSPQFYSKIIRPTFRKGGIFYVLPDSVPVQTAFPAYLQQPAQVATKRAKKERRVREDGE